MGEVVNLNKVRKARDKRDARQKAETNRVVHGLSRAEREAALRDADRNRAALDGHRREPSED